MKRISAFMCTLLISVFMITAVFGSSLIEYKGKYQNLHVIFNATYESTSWFYYSRGREREGSSDTVTFFIKSKPGFRIVNKSFVTFKSKVHKFKGIEFVNQYYKYGKITFKGKLKNNDKLKITYFIYKASTRKVQRIVKKFKVVIPRRPRGSHDTIKIKLVEL